MINKVYDYCSKFNMFDDCDNIVVGLSGGADSVCLLLVLKDIITKYKLSIELIAVHVNHQIRGDEADFDEAFSRKLCERLGIDFVVIRKNVPQIAKENGLSEEEAGRLVRYDAFRQYCDISKKSKIAVAHHMDDQAETVLMNIFRGSSLRGASGILPVRDNVIRPLLCVTRMQIEHFLKERSQDFVTDSTNAGNDYTRNRLRNELIPYIKEHFNENFVENIGAQATDFSLAYEYIRDNGDKLYSMCVEETQNGVRLKLNEFRQEHMVVKREVIMLILKKLSRQHKDIYRKHIEAVIRLADMQVGRSVNLPYGIVVTKSYDVLMFDKFSGQKSEQLNSGAEIGLTKEQLSLIDSGSRCEIPLGIRILGENGELVTAKSISFEIIKFIENLNGNVYTKYFDYGKIRDNLCVRFKKNEDYLVISADGKRKLLSKEFVDRKIPREYRDSVLMVASESEILWAVGVRRSNNAYVDEQSVIVKISLEVEA